MEEVTLSPQAENSRFRKIVTLLKLLLCEMNKNPSYQLTITPKSFESYLYLKRKYICIIPLVSLILT